MANSLAPYGLKPARLLSEKAMAPHSSTLAWKIPQMEEPGRLQSMGSQRVRHDWETSLSLSLSFSDTGEGYDNPLQYSCLENPRDGSLVGCRLWGRTELDTTEWLSTHTWPYLFTCLLFQSITSKSKLGPCLLTRKDHVGYLTYINNNVSEWIKISVGLPIGQMLWFTCIISFNIY